MKIHGKKWSFVVNEAILKKPIARAAWELEGFVMLEGRKIPDALKINDSKQAEESKQDKSADLVSVSDRRGKKKPPIEEQAIVDMLKEAKAMHHVEHPNVVKMYGVVIEAPITLAIELCNYSSLNKYRDGLENDQQMSETQAAYLSNQCAWGLEFLHYKKVIHRDISARNVLLQRVETSLIAKISDFGMSRIGEIYQLTRHNVKLPIRFYGYLTYGNDVQASVTLNLTNSPLDFAVKCMLLKVVFSGLLIQQFPLVEVIWPPVKEWLNEKKVSRPKRILYEYLFRYSIVFIALGLSFAIPNLDDIIPLVGVTAGMMLALMLPACLETICFLPVWLKEWPKWRIVLQLASNGFFAARHLFYRDWTHSQHQAADQRSLRNLIIFTLLSPCDDSFTVHGGFFSIRVVHFFLSIPCILVSIIIELINV